MSKGETATYLYGLVQSEKPPSVAGVPSGLAGMKAPRLVDAGNSLWLIAADAPLSRYGQAPIEAGLQDLKWVSACAMAHEQVIEHFAGTGTVIPMKLFTLFTSDQRASLHIRETRKELDATIKRVAGCREWGVRMSLNEGRAAAAARSEIQPKTRKGSPGTQFLLLKKKAMDVVRELQQHAASEAESAYHELQRYAQDARRLPTVQGEGSTRVILDAAFLVPLGKEKRFRAAVEKLTGRVARRYEVRLTGPWPPYNFIVKAK